MTKYFIGKLIYTPSLLFFIFIAVVYVTTILAILNRNSVLKREAVDVAHIVVIDFNFVPVRNFRSAKSANFAHYVATCPREDLPFFLAFVCMFREKILIGSEDRQLFHFNAHRCQSAAQKEDNKGLID